MYEIYLVVRDIGFDVDVDSLAEADLKYYLKHPSQLFRVSANDPQLLYSDELPDDIYKLTAAKLTMEDNSSGSLEITIPTSNACYDLLKCMMCEAMVYKDKEEIWRGRLLTIKEDFWKQRQCVFEGELSYLCDTCVSSLTLVHADIQAKIKSTTDTLVAREILNELINEHNRQVEPYKQFYFMPFEMSVDDINLLVDNAGGANYITINSKTTLDAIKQIVIDKNRLHIRIYHHPTTDQRYIYFTKDDQHIAKQEINFGENLLDFAKEIQGFDQCTAIIARGKKLEVDKSEEAFDVEKYVRIFPDGNKNSNEYYHQDGMKLYLQGFDDTHNNLSNVYDLKGMEKRGLILGIVDWSNVSDPAKLRQKAIKYFKKAKYNDVTSVEITAVDLHYLNPSIESFALLENVHCVSEPHGLDVLFPVTKIAIDILNPENTKYTLGGEVKGVSSATSSNTKNFSNVHQTKEKIPEQITKSQILEFAEGMATDGIIKSIPGSYASWLYSGSIVVNGVQYPPKPQEIQYTVGKDSNGRDIVMERPFGFLVRDGKDDANSLNRWVWVSGGLMHQSKVNGVWQNANVALTMDGHIVAERIEAGAINIYSGTGVKKGQKVTALNVFSGENLIGSWSNKGIDIKAGSIHIYKKDKKGHFTTRFFVDEDGSMIAKSGTFEGEIKAATGTFTGTVEGGKVVGGKIVSGNPYEDPPNKGESKTAKKKRLERNAEGSVEIESGKLLVRNGKTGHARFQQAYKDDGDKAYEGEYCTIGGSRWDFYYHKSDGGWGHQSFNTRSLIKLFEVAIKNNWLDENDLY